MKKKKLEKIDMDQLKDLRQKYQEINLQLGMITTDEYMLKNQLEEINNLKNKCFESINQTRNDESTLLKSLEEKYGQGQINLEEGVFISND
tara:strand:- start:1679 stop:1951 length:273 start_codon:yes stop_codon:yes gene_type:complete